MQQIAVAVGGVALLVARSPAACELLHRTGWREVAMPEGTRP